MRIFGYISVIVFTWWLPELKAQDTITRRSDTLLFRGMLSSWMNVNPQLSFPIWIGARYIPQANYRIKFPKDRLIDFEASVNVTGHAGFAFPENTLTDGNLSPYRLWGRYSTNQFEARIGLQKINFGSATMFRPLMWFDQIDPRDPLQLTNGVYAALGRYYFLNNSNIWLWAIYPGKLPKNWEISSTSRDVPEFGGRFQTPVKRGETGVSYHYRMADTRQAGFMMSQVPESRIGIDAKWDLGVGLWYELVWINKARYTGEFTNQALLTVGSDYTFKLGNGLNLIFEQFLFSYDREPFALSNAITMSALSLAYPVSMLDNISALVYYDWMNGMVYNFINWKRQFRQFYLYTMVYLNPEQSLLPQQQGTFNQFSGKGIQLMLVYNH